jgi:hypothetical protein
MFTLHKPWLLFSAFMAFSVLLIAQKDDPRQEHYWKTVRPLFRKHCYSCHNGEDNKAGLNLERYDFIIAVVRDGEVFQRVIKEVENRSMPPDIRPPMKQEEIDTLTHYINSYLQTALAEKDPGIISPRRLNNQEYRYAIKDLLGVEINVDSIFPADPSGGAGFDNQARTLYLSPLLMERYFETADHVIEGLHQDTEAWRGLVPQYRSHIGVRLRNWWYQTFYNQDVSLERPTAAASEVLFPFATLAYRRFLSQDDKSKLLSFFKDIYQQQAAGEDRFDTSIKETMKLVLMSHNFLYRQESDPDIAVPYEITNFELASRLSFFLWSSVPDLELLNVAYRENLHDPVVLEREVLRMLESPKARRLSEQFAIQWLELKKLEDPTFQIDPEIFPEYTPVLRELMLSEVEQFFSHILFESKNFLDLIDSDYTFMNEQLAAHYGISGIEGDTMRKVQFTDDSRGGILGMAGVLTGTSLPTRTSPVLRGKWVLEQVLGTPAPPPPADVPELEASHDTNKIETLRAVLERHRADPACRGCHQAMDPIGLGLENFDGIGRWRTAYGTEQIDPSGVMKTGEVFAGPAELRKILVGKKDLFAKNFSQKMLSYALGRSLGFKDTPTIEDLQNTLLETNFNSDQFIKELVKSYPFRFKKSDHQEVLNKQKDS